MSGDSNVVYTYDGSFEGFLTCIYESFYNRENPVDIVPEYLCQPTLYVEKYIASQPQKAQRVYISIQEKISVQAQTMVRLGFLTCLPQKELCMLLYLRLGYKVGSKLTNMLGNARVSCLHGAVKSMQNEAHLLKGFIRFQEYSGVLVAVISPKNFVLPLLSQHFATRYPNESFLIYDDTNHMALVYQNNKTKIVEIEKLTLPPVDAQEANYAALWQQFYKTIAIQARNNPRCQRGHMPKRYWKNMTEMQTESRLSGRDTEKMIQAGGKTI
ncbi:MAG: TIGR03915 family putative DNA repair protein [Oscillospiraceae bacterium]|nr:TIGR03915 family putative DNA repair protein [Oscillospiraceae bacterium]